MEAAISTSPAPVAASEKRSAPLAQNATTNAATLEVNAGLLTVADRPLESGIDEDLSGAGTNIESKQDARSATNGMDQTGVLEEPLQVAPPPNAEPVTVPQDGAHQLEVAAAPEAGIELVDSNAVVVATTSLTVRLCLMRSSHRANDRGLWRPRCGRVLPGRTTSTQVARAPSGSAALAANRLGISVAS